MISCPATTIWPSSVGSTRLMRYSRGGDELHPCLSAPSVGPGPDARGLGPALVLLRQAVRERFGGRHAQLLFRHDVQLLRLLWIELVVHEHAQHLHMFGRPLGQRGRVAQQVRATNTSQGPPYAPLFFDHVRHLLRTPLVLDTPVRIGGNIERLRRPWWYKPPTCNPEAAIFTVANTVPSPFCSARTRLVDGLKELRQVACLRIDDHPGEGRRPACVSGLPQSSPAGARSARPWRARCRTRPAASFG
jgi:hypothetical protein